MSEQHIEQTCEICGEEFDQTQLEKHLLTSHHSMSNRVREGHPEIYEKYESEFESDEEVVRSAFPALFDDEDGEHETTADAPSAPVVEEVSGDTADSDRADEQPDASADLEGGPPADAESTDANGEQEEMSVDGFLDGNRGRQKWFLIGIGGCGGNIVDAILLRAKALEEQRDHPLSDAWKGAVRGVGIVNTDSNSELASTYFAQEYKSRPASNVADTFHIGPPPVQGAGNIEQKASELTEWTFDRDDQNFAGSQWGDALLPHRISEAQGVMMVHSAVKGTGTGASPVIAQRLNEDVLDDEYDFDFVDTSSLFSSIILPSKGDLDGIEKRNGLVGTARLAREADAIIPFDNDKLGNAADELRVPIPGTENYSLANHQAENEVFVSFLETMSLTSTAPDGDSPSQNLGDQFDVEDAYNPAKDLMPADYDSDDLPAILLAPAYGHVDAGGTDIDRDLIDELVSRTLIRGKLVDFDHQTAWGGSFLIVSSGEYSEQVKDVGEYNLRSILAKEEYLDFDLDDDSRGVIPTKDYYIKVPGVDGIRMLGVLYNPEMPRLAEWRDWAEAQRSRGDKLSRRINDKWDEIEELFQLLGRDRREAFLEESKR
jgi:hypothetical protein